RSVALEQSSHDTHLDRLAGDVDVEPVAQRERVDEVAAMEDVLDEPLLDEMADGLPHRAAARLQLPREMHLPQVRAGRDQTVDDRVAEDAVDLLQRGRSFDGRQVPHLTHDDPHHVRLTYKPTSGRIARSGPQGKRLEEEKA